VLLADGEQELAQLGSEVASASLVGPRLGTQRVQATLLVGVVPALQGGDYSQWAAGGTLWATIVNSGSVTTGTVNIYVTTEMALT
jgi:hypothetical protein